MNKNFWIEALKGGTIIGLVSVGFSILSQTMGAESEGLLKVVNILSSFIVIMLAFGLTRKFAATHTLEQGFSFGRALGFVLAMMLFMGFIQGLYSAVMAKFFIGEELLMEVDKIMASSQDLLPADQFDQTYQMMRKAVTSPVIITLSAMFSNLFYGVLVGLCVALFTRRRPDIFADGNQTPQQ